MMRDTMRAPAHYDRWCIASISAPTPQGLATRVRTSAHDMASACGASGQGTIQWPPSRKQGACSGCENQAQMTNRSTRHRAKIQNTRSSAGLCDAHPSKGLWRRA